MGETPALQGERVLVVFQVLLVAVVAVSRVLPAGRVVASVAPISSIEECFAGIPGRSGSLLRQYMLLCVQKDKL